ncbi:MAG: hypothetical protein NC093_10815 [Alistipes sp.]|nr:hypothetical protein [Alistipes sp.]
MNVKKIIKGVVGLGVVSGIAYLAYKVGEGCGEINERFRDVNEENDISPDDEEDFNFYDNMDEPDDGCISPYHTEKGKYFRLGDIDTASWDKDFLATVLLHIKMNPHITNKELRDFYEITKDEAEEILDLFEKAGYVSEKNSNYRRRVLVNGVNLYELI